MRSNLFIFSIIILAVFGVYVVFSGQTSFFGDTTPPSSERTSKSEGTTPDSPISKDYVSQDFGFRFPYPATYYLEEHEEFDSRRLRHSLLLTEDTQEYQLLREGKLPPGREGPPSITIEALAYREEPESLEDWLKNSNDSNFKLGGGTFETAAIGGKEGISYSWSGLYEANTIAVRHNDAVIMFTVNYLTSNDQIRKDFNALLSQIEFE